jgi:antitoxin ParD1/3/4
MPNQFFHDARPTRKGESAQMEQAKLDPLRDAAKRGLEDLVAGRYIDVSDDELDRYIAELGARASQSARSDR